MATSSEEKDNDAVFIDKQLHHSTTPAAHSTIGGSSSSGANSSNSSGSNTNSSKFTKPGCYNSSGDSSSSSRAACRKTDASTTDSSSSSRGDTSNYSNASFSEGVSGTRSNSSSSSSSNSRNTTSNSSSSSSVAHNNGSAERNTTLSHEDGPYSRLLALQRLGVVKNYAAIREKTVAIVGVGGIGAVAAEMLTRCGVGRLLLFDYDRVEAENMNRLFFRPHQIGFSKVEAARETLQAINSDVDIQIFNCDICRDFDVLLSCLAEQQRATSSSSSNISSSSGNTSSSSNSSSTTTSSSSSDISSSSGDTSSSSGNTSSGSSNTGNSSSSSDSNRRTRRGESKGKPVVDLLLSCVDNYAARITISQACNEAGVVWMNSGVSESAINGQIQTIIPGLLACFQCAPPYIVATDGDELGLRREGVCAASLPSTMAIVAGLLVQNALKYLLHFGEVSTLLSFDTLRNFFYSLVLQPNPFCADAWCQQQQKKVKKDRLSVSACLHFPITPTFDALDETAPEHASTGIHVLAEGDEDELLLPLINAPCGEVKPRKSDDDGANSCGAASNTSGNTGSNSVGGRDNGSGNTSSSNLDTIRSGSSSSSTPTSTETARGLIASEAGTQNTEAEQIAGSGNELQKCSVEQLREELKRLQS